MKEKTIDDSDDMITGGLYRCIRVTIAYLYPYNDFSTSNKESSFWNSALTIIEGELIMILDQTCVTSTREMGSDVIDIKCFVSSAGSVVYIPTFSLNKRNLCLSFVRVC